MFINLLEIINDNSKLKKRLYIAAVILSLILVALFFKPKAYADEYSFTKTNLKDSTNFARLQSSDLYYYNGSGFYKRDLSTGTQQILSTGLRLPTISKLFWADAKGVLLNFKGGYYYSILEGKLNSMGEKISKASKNYTWYLDFSTGQLSLVARYPVRSDATVYSKGELGFYYIEDNFSATNSSDSEYHSEATGTPLNFFDISTKVSKQVSQNLPIDGISNLYECPARVGSRKVCAAGVNLKDSGGQALYSIDASSGSVEKIFQSEGLLLPTSDLNYYVSIKQEVKTKDEEREEGGSVSGPAKLHNLGDGSVKDFKFNLSGAGSVLYIGQNGRFYALDEDFNLSLESSKLNFYRSGSFDPDIQKDITIGSQLLNTESPQSRQALRLINTSGYGDDGLSLINSFEADQYLFFRVKSTIPKVDVNSPQESKSVVQSCSSQSGAQDLQYSEQNRNFKVFFTDTENMNIAIKTYLECLSKSDFYGYNFTIGVTDSVSRRIVSD